MSLKIFNTVCCYNFSVQDLREFYTELTNVKRIKVRPPKRGHLYPCLSDIEATTETESEVPDDERWNSIYIAMIFSWYFSWNFCLKFLC
jgi:hypothetical protein